jgi:hypothetical protein
LRSEPYELYETRSRVGSSFQVWTRLLDRVPIYLSKDLSPRALSLPVSRKQPRTMDYRGSGEEKVSDERIVWRQARKQISGAAYFLLANLSFVHTVKQCEPLAANHISGGNTDQKNDEVHVYWHKLLSYVHGRASANPPILRFPGWPGQTARPESWSFRWISKQSSVH